MLYRTKDAQGVGFIHVYYGLELLEVIPDDRQDPMFRSMIARLRNAGFKLKSLVEVFNLDPKTIRSWGNALKSRDPARMQAMLFGPHSARKLTLAIENFVLKRLPELLAERRKDFRATLQREIKTLFETRLSTETLRILIANVKAKFAQPIDFDDPPTTTTVEPSCEELTDPVAEPLGRESFAREPLGNDGATHPPEQPEPLNTSQEATMPSKLAPPFCTLSPAAHSSVTTPESCSLPQNSSPCAASYRTLNPI